MPFDADALLRDGSTADVEDAEGVPTSLDLDGVGARVLDIRKTGAKGIVAVMSLPTAPTVFTDTLGVVIQASDYVTTDWKDIASFPTLYALNRRLRVKVTTPYVASSIGQTVIGDSTTDNGVIRWYDRALEVAGGVGDLVVSQVAADSDFDEIEGLTGGTGVSTMQKVSELTLYLSYGLYAVRFVTSKRYVRASLTPSGGCNFGLVMIGLVDHWNFPITAQ